MCIVTIHKYINIDNLIKTCILYRRLGVDHITLYISYYNKTYNNQYKWLKEKYWIEIINFTLPNISIYYFGQESKINHCINHYRYLSDYVIITDVDEVIVPQNNNKIIDVIYKYGRKNYVFIFKSVQYLVNNTFSNILTADNKGCIFKNGYEKMILRPEKIVSIGAHFPKIWEEKRNLTYVSVKDGYVRHTRKRFKKLNCNEIKENKFFTNLKNEVEKKYKSLKLS